MQKRHFCFVVIGLGFLALGVMISFSPRTALAAIGFTPVRDVTNPALQPFLYEKSIIIPPGDGSGSDTLTVPSGKQLVIEFVSCHAAVPASEEIEYLRVSVTNPGKTGVDFHFPATFQAQWVEGYNGYITALPTRIYADSGAVVDVGILRSSIAQYSYADFSLSGHLVNRP